uniref:Uncharacterized protein n=1 Tax=Timema bartmani TaxID=61472 RepID=A0A7R9F3T7_9NEOP|nr:unnamed protein product [Timema bartmani]
MSQLVPYGPQVLDLYDDDSSLITMYSDWGKSEKGMGEGEDLMDGFELLFPSPMFPELEIPRIEDCISKLEFDVGRS